MNITEAYSYVQKVNQVFFKGYHWVIHVRNNPTIYELIDAKWYDDFKQKHLDHHPLILEQQSTFENCVQCFLHCQDGLRLRLLIFDGDMLYGEPKSRRCEFIYGVRKIHSDLVAILESSALEVASTIYEEEQERRKQKIIKKKSLDLLYGSQNR